MDDEIQLISDGDGLAVIGDPAAIERFLVSEGLPSKDLGLHRLGPALGKAAGVAQTGSEIAANSGRWMQLTEESAKVATKFPLVKNSSSGNLHATLRAQNGQFVKNLQFVKGPGSLLTNPALLAGAAGSSQGGLPEVVRRPRPDHVVNDVRCSIRIAGQIAAQPSGTSPKRREAVLNRGQATGPPCRVVCEARRPGRSVRHPLPDGRWGVSAGGRCDDHHAAADRP